MDHLHAVVPGSNVDGLACAEQWVSLAEASSGRRRTSHKQKSVVSGVLPYETKSATAGLAYRCSAPFRVCPAEVHGVRPATFIKLVLRAPSHGQVTGIDAADWSL